MKIKTNLKLTSFQLKLLAIITMTIDHIGFFLINPPLYFVFRCIGRIAFPLFCFMIAEGFTHTKSIKNYILRLSLLAIISEPIIDKCYYGSFFYTPSQNVILLFVIALLTLYFLKKFDNRYSNILCLKFFFRVLFISLGCIAVYISKTEYGCFGLIMIISSYYFKKNISVLIASLLACNFFFLDPLQAFGGLAVIPLIFYDGEKGNQCKAIKFFEYFYYPFHVFVLYILMSSFFQISNSSIISYEQDATDFFKQDSNYKSELSTNTDNIVLDEEIILFISHLPFETTVSEEKFETLTLGQGEIAVFLHGKGETFNIQDGKSLQFTSNIVSSENKVQLKFGVVKNNRVIILNTLTEKYVNVTLDNSVDKSYLVIINESGHEIKLENVKIDLR